jgi:acetyl esterase/lipase
MAAMMRFLALALLAVASPANAQAAAPPAGPVLQIIPEIERPQVAVSVADSKTADPAAADEQWLRAFGQTWVRNVKQPSLYPYLPPKGKAKGKAVIIVPGGGYSFVSIESEGFRLAERLSAEGYTSFVLKYRPRATAADLDMFKAELSAGFQLLGKAPLPDHPPAVDDLSQAIAAITADAEKWGIDPARIGVIGFSAGSRSVIRLLESSPEAAKLGHVALIYPPMTARVAPGPRPPLFMAIATDDPLFRQGKLGMLSAWLDESEAVEAHFYAGGDHGFGMFPRGTTSDLWATQYLAWLEHQ